MVMSFIGVGAPRIETKTELTSNKKVKPGAPTQGGSHPLHHSEHEGSAERRRGRVLLAAGRGGGPRPR